MPRGETPTPTAQLLDEDHDCRGDNDSYDDPPFRQGSERGMCEGSIPPSTEAGANMEDAEIWTPLTGWIGVSGSSVSSRDIETYNRHFTEPLIGQVNTSWSRRDSTEHHRCH